MQSNVLTAPAPTRQRARGAVAVHVAPGGRMGSRLTDLRQEGSFRVLFPRSADLAVEAVLLNTAGGITDGDRFDTQVQVASGGFARLTTQAAERIYGAAGTEPGQVRTQCTIGVNGRVQWMPQETILFDTSRLSRKLHVDLAAGARALVVEPVVFGRLTSGEKLRHIYFDDRISIDRDGQPIYRDAVRLVADPCAVLDRAGLGGGMRAMANLVLVDPDAARFLDPIRALCGDASPDGIRYLGSAGVSLLRDDVLVLRALAPDSYDLRQRLVPILALLTDSALPKTWSL